MTIDANHMSDQGPLFSFPMAQMGSSLSGLVMLDPHSAPIHNGGNFSANVSGNFNILTYSSMCPSLSIYVDIPVFKVLASVRGNFPKVQFPLM